MLEEYTVLSDFIPLFTIFYRISSFASVIGIFLSVAFKWALDLDHCMGFGAVDDHSSGAPDIIFSFRVSFVIVVLVLFLSVRVCDSITLELRQPNTTSKSRNLISIITIQFRIDR